MHDLQILRSEAAVILVVSDQLSERFPADRRDAPGIEKPANLISMLVEPGGKIPPAPWAAHDDEGRRAAAKESCQAEEFLAVGTPQSGDDYGLPIALNQDIVEPI